MYNTAYNEAHKAEYTLSKCGHKNASDSGDTCQVFFGKLPQLLEIVFCYFHHFKPCFGFTNKRKMDKLGYRESMPAAFIIKNC